MEDFDKKSEEEQMEYAATDEFHQLFVAGRSGEIKDVCIDGIGAMVGVLIGLAVLNIIYKTKKISLHETNKI